MTSDKFDAKAREIVKNQREFERSFEYEEVYFDSDKELISSIANALRDAASEQSLPDAKTIAANVMLSNEEVDAQKVLDFIKSSSGEQCVEWPSEEAFIKYAGFRCKENHDEWRVYDWLRSQVFIPSIQKQRIGSLQSIQ